MKKIIVTLSIIAVVLGSCKKDPVEEAPAPTTPTDTVGSLKIEFENMVDTNALVFNTEEYVNASGDTFTVSKFKYYITNVVLTKSDGSTFVESNSYHLVDEDVASSKVITLSNVPFGTYTGITFLLGVDSLRNVSGAQTGELDPAKGMFWSWSSGYIMLKMEGTAANSNATNHALTFHVGGFSGVNSAIRSINPSFNGATATVSSTVTPEIHIKTDLMEMFKSPNTINFAMLNTVHMPGAMAKTIADNYADMFSIEHIHN